MRCCPPRRWPARWPWPLCRSHRCQPARHQAGRGAHRGWRRLLATGLAAGYAAGYARPQYRAVAAPTAANIQASVAAGITGLPALQGALMARSGATVAAATVALAAPLGRRLARWWSPT